MLMILNRFTGTALSVLLLASASVVAAAEPDEADPLAAGKDPDFALQGEYADTTRGVHAIAMGEGEFRVVIYTDGLPGAGWNGKEKQTLEVDADELTAMLKQFQRVERKSPTLGAKPPSGAVVLFDGTKESLEKHWKPGARISEDGLLMQGCMSKETFGDYSMHLEFRLPFMPKARGQGRGNSGLYHQGRYETQILDSFGLEGKNNETGGLYSIRDPDVNLCLPPLAWQTYDVDFTAARYNEAGKKTANAQITVKLNGVVVHRDVELPRTTTAAPIKEGPEDGPIYLQDHGNPVRYRNIWVRPRDIDAEARRPIVPGFERFHTAAGNPVDGGQLLLGELNCVACHQAQQQLVGLIQPKQAPILDKVGERLQPEWMIKYIADPHQVKPGTTMPDMMAGKNAQQRRQAAVALTNFLVGTSSIKAGGKSGNSGAGEQLFHQSGCVACHLPRNDKKASADTSIPLVGLDQKYTRASLEEFLKNPLAVRPSGRMPQLELGGDNWRHVAQYLTGDVGVTFGNQKDLPKEPNMKFAAYYLGVDRLPDLNKLEPDLTGFSRGLDISAGRRDTNVVISFTGYLPIKTAGKYSFRLSSDDGSNLYIDGKKVVDNDGVHGNESREATIQLNPGAHEIRVDWFEKDGGEELSLDWAGPGVKSGRIDKAIVISRDESDLPVAAKPEQVDPNVFVYDESKVNEGRQLFSQLGCAACHVRTEGGKRIESSLAAPQLSKLDSSKGCLSSTEDSDAQSVPNYDLISMQRDALAVAIGASGRSGEPTADMRLAQTMKSLNCYACHSRDGRGGAESDRNQLFISSIPEMGDEGRLPPPLDGVGDKLREDWIKKVVSNGAKNRPYMKTYMPKFGEQNAAHLAAIFTGMDARSEAEIPNTDEPEHRRVALGRQMVGAKGLACVSCHTFGKFPSTGIQAIALDTMAGRIREDWFHRYMLDPQQYRPGTRMPTGYPEGKSTVTDVYDGEPAKQLAAMWAYLEKGSSGGVPEGIVSGMIELKPEAKPIIYRNFIEGVSPRGIAVGYPEKAHLCWDANNLSLALIWQDRFIDAAKHWVGRGPGNQTPLGGSVMKFEKVAPVAVLADEHAAWPIEPPKQRGYKFLGYRLDKQGRPTFRYRTVAAEVEDKPIPVAGEFVGTFKRQIKITPIEGADVAGKIYFRAAGGNLKATDDGWYLIDDAIRIRIDAERQAIMREVGGSRELLVPVSGPITITQEIVW